MQGHRLCTDWARDTRIRMLLRRAKSEIVLFCDDEGFLARYAGDLAREAKGVHVYLVVGRTELAESAPVRCYTGGSDTDPFLFCHNAGEKMEPSLKVLLIADRRESLPVVEDNGTLKGIFTCPDLDAGYLLRKIVQENQPVQKS